MAITELQPFGEAGYTLLPESWAPDGCRGADKAAARFLYGLLTPIGTVPGRPQDGSFFIRSAANFRSEFDLFSAFSGAYGSAAQTARAAEEVDDPDSEKFGSARLNSISFVDGLVILNLTVEAVDGSRPTKPVDFSLET